MDCLLKEQNDAKLDYDKSFESPSNIRRDFQKIWKNIVQKTGLDIISDESCNEIKNLVIYDILDGNRSTLNLNSRVASNFETPLYTLRFVHTLKSLGAKNCYIMIHTSYNRERGTTEFNHIIKKITMGTPLIKKYVDQNNIRCFCIGMQEDYELMHALNDIMESTKNGDFCTYFLFDYNEKWLATKYAQDMLDNMPDIDVYVRHTKFQPSGGWIPEKMSHSVFLYSQNGSVCSNWSSDELVVLISLSLLAKILHKGEILNKTYMNKKEIKQRYGLREGELFNKSINLRANPKKLFMMGSPWGIYQFYY